MDFEKIRRWFDNAGLQLRHSLGKGEDAVKLSQGSPQLRQDGDT